VSDDDGLVADQDVFDDEADDPLTFLDVEGVSSGPLPIQEARDGLCPLSDKPISSETSNGRAVVHARRRSAISGLAEGNQGVCRGANRRVRR
jgi:hypothetical protein